MILQAPPCRLITQMLNLIGKEPAHERRIEPEEDSMGRRVHTNVCLASSCLRFPENGERILKVTKKSGNRGRCRKLVFLFLDRSWRVNWLINGPYLLQPRHFQDVKEDILRLYSYGLQH